MVHLRPISKSLSENQSHSIDGMIARRPLPQSELKTRWELRFRSRRPMSWVQFWGSCLGSATVGCTVRHRVDDGTRHGFRRRLRPVQWMIQDLNSIGGLATSGDATRFTAKRPGVKRPLPVAGHSVGNPLNHHTTLRTGVITPDLNSARVDTPSGLYIWSAQVPCRVSQPA
jgi:hypothetical protein